MQNRMKEHQLEEEQITGLLERATVGNLATIDKSGYPYAVPVHFIYHDGRIYIHGLPHGQKISNILANEKVCFEAHDMKGLILDEAPCDVNTEYESVVIIGTAALIDDHSLKEAVLDRVVEKYTPSLKGAALPDNMVRGTAIIEVTIKECTGKYYK
ncbi:MAG: pyridoxamine 5'-phosphate oxidase family protein [Methanolobus sp.]|uniref:pyridoxamine 5'-phosphate oxidase family protein n=1 Tax=Methanolobus sp. TaxID=1874737 RepID=UPI002730538A|nr:pyridoxamine 5'-phosphate oxidase family protein [Methanolobus sp.]MDP2217135.1 pyridoxamine 5'-phosphate oxidase family protein [Methanolobus sp.]